MKLSELKRKAITHFKWAALSEINPHLYMPATDLVEVTKALTGRLANQMDDIAVILQKECLK